MALTLRRAAMLGGLPLCLVGCGGATDPVFPPDAIPMEPLAPYRTWWHLVEACSGLSGDFGRVRWFTSSGITREGKHYSGAWVNSGNRIVLATGRQTDGGTVRHEMLHDLVGRAGHPQAYFVDRCGALTPCEQECGLTEQTRGVPADAAEIGYTQVAVTVRVDPAPPSAHVDEGWFRITVTATNTRAAPVWVRLRGAVAFSYSEARRAGSGILTDEPRWAFRANESRSYIFDEQYAPGTYTLVAGFGGAYALPVTFTLVP